MNKFKRLVVVHSPASSRAPEYAKKVTAELSKIAAARHLELREIAIDDTPYFAAVQLICDTLRDGDVVFGAGGDGVNQATLQGIFASNRDVAAGFLPLGNANDFATALNGRIKNPEKILDSPTLDFHPLELTINHQEKFFIAAYATFGVTAVAVDYLNSAETRDTRRRLHNLPPMAALRPRQFAQMSRDINNLAFPAFRRDGAIYHDDSVGFFLVPAAKGVLRAPGVSNFLAREDFFFHSDNVRHKSGKSWLSKGLRAGRWATLGLPGAVSDFEKLEFLEPADMTIHVGGDTVKLEKVRTISAERAQLSVKIFAPKFESLQS
jgi:hypothetical protein